MPFVLPPVIMALGFLLFYTGFGLHGQHGNVIVAHGIFLVALPLVTVCESDRFRTAASSPCTP